MDELCPLCLKMGSNRRIKAVQINLDEAIWMCENEECTWPFGHQVPNFLPRKVGEKWSNQWEIYKKVQKRIGSIPVSTELSLYTPPVTPIADDTTKESVKSELSNDTNITEQIKHIGNIFSSNTTPDDSYAPKLTSHDEYTRNGIKEDEKIANTIVKKLSQCTTDSRTVVQTNSVQSSIFDIDGDELTSNKISIKESCNETKKIVLSSPMSEILDLRNFTKIVDTAVLKTSEKPEISTETFVDVKKDEIIISSGQKDTMTKIMPQIRSISRTNIDLQNMVKIEKIDFQRSDEIEKMDTSNNMEITYSSMNIENMDTSNNMIERVDSLEKIEKPELRIKIEETDLTKTIVKTEFPKYIEKSDSSKKFESTFDDKSVISSKRRSFDYTTSPTKRTTTITLDGSLPITLSYDLTDLEEKSEKIISLTSTSIREENKKTSFIRENDERNKSTELLSVELPKKKIRPLAKRRAAAALIGKQYEKFKFSDLKKFVPASKNSDVRSGSVILMSKRDDRVKFEKITNIKKEETLLPPGSRVVDSEIIANNGISDLSNQLVESLNSVNIESVNEGVIGDDPIVEGLNISNVLDDILMEGYQNVTENLNDDWLESFFTQDT